MDEVWGKKRILPTYIFANTGYSFGRLIDLLALQRRPLAKHLILQVRK